MNMNRYFLSLIFSLLLGHTFSFAQTTKLDSLINKAQQAYEDKDYAVADKTYRELRKHFKKGTKDYEIASDQVCMIYHAKRMDLRQEGKHKEAIKYLEEALKYIEQEKAYIRPFWNKENRYYFLEELVINYFALGEYAAAKKYQFELYQMHYKKELPKNNQGFYTIDQFIYEGKLVTGFEYFAKLGDPNNKISFAKVIYEVVETDEKGNPDKLAFELQVLGIHKRNPNDPNVPDYYLSKLMPGPSKEMSGIIHEFSYNRVIDYDKLKKDIDKVLKGEYKKKMKPN